MKLIYSFEITSKLNENTVNLHDLYDEEEISDRSEAKFAYIDSDDLEKDFEIHVMTPEQAKTYVTSDNDVTVIDTYNNFATAKQKSIIQNKINKWDSNRIILTINNTVLDGNHHLVAGILSNRPIKYINLAD